jgi:TM2 domain-containing membrane protein YozV
MKSSFLAGALSFIVPGAALGQFYNEEYVNWGIRVAISAICVTWFLASPSINSGGGGNADQKLITALLFSVNWIASIIDASVSATKHNSKSEIEINNLKNFHISLNNKEFNLSIHF